MKTCETCRFFRMRYDGSDVESDEPTIPYCMEHEHDVDSDAKSECWQEYRNID